MAQKGQKDAGSSFAGNLAQGLKHLPLLDRIMLIGKAHAEESKRIADDLKARLEARGKDDPKPGDVYRLQFGIENRDGDVIDFIELVCISEGTYMLANPLCKLKGDLKRNENGFVRFYHISGPQIMVYRRSSILVPENRCDVVSAATIAAIESAYDHQFPSMPDAPQGTRAIEVDSDEDDPANDRAFLVGLIQEIAEKEGVGLPSEGPASLDDKDVVDWLHSAEESGADEPEDLEDWARILEAHADEIAVRHAYDRWFHEAESEARRISERPVMDCSLTRLLNREEIGIGIQDFRPGWMIARDTGDDEFRDLNTSHGIWGPSCFETLFPGLENPWKSIE